MDAVVCFIQVIVYFSLIIPVKFFFRPQARFIMRSELIPKGTVFVANHQSRLDVFLIFLTLPPCVFLRLLPIYGLVAQKYMDTWWKKIALTCFGTYPVKSGKRGAIEALVFCLEKISHHHTLLIFPEGKVVKRKDTASAHPGVGYLAKINNVAILPVFLSGFKNVHLLPMLRGEYRAQIVFGELRRYYKSSGAPKLISKAVLKYIYLTLPAFL